MQGPSWKLYQMLRTAVFDKDAAVRSAAKAAIDKECSEVLPPFEAQFILTTDDAQLQALNTSFASFNRHEHLEMKALTLELQLSMYHSSRGTIAHPVSGNVQTGLWPMASAVAVAYHSPADPAIAINDGKRKVVVEPSDRSTKSRSGMRSATAK